MPPSYTAEEERSEERRGQEETGGGAEQEERVFVYVTKGTGPSPPASSTPSRSPYVREAEPRAVSPPLPAPTSTTTSTPATRRSCKGEKLSGKDDPARDAIRELRVHDVDYHKHEEAEPEELPKTKTKTAPSTLLPPTSLAEPNARSTPRSRAYCPASLRLAAASP